MYQHQYHAADVRSCLRARRKGNLSRAQVTDCETLERSFGACEAQANACKTMQRIPAALEGGDLVRLAKLALPPDPVREEIRLPA